MQKILGYLKDHLKKDFHVGLYCAVAVFLLTTITINYIYDFEDGVIDAYYGREIRFLWYFLFYAFAYFFTVLLVVIFHKRTIFFKKKLFWLYSLVGIVVISFDGGFHYHYTIAYYYLPTQVSEFAYKLLSNLNSLLTIWLPLCFFYYWSKQQENGFYGFTSTNLNLKPYGWMLLIMFPLILWASFQPDFLSDYPSYKGSTADEYLGVPSWLTVLLFELAYGLDFVSTELIFRGFFIIGMVHILGKDAILPMVTMYAFLHFGKPLGETIGSIFGGYILGVIALYSRNIWGGVAIHLGVAWLMELAAFLQLLRLTVI